jgi:hypothetical protein
MIREIIGFLMLTLVAAIALFVWLRTRARREKQESELQVPLPAARAGEFESFYVSTVFAANPLERVWAHGLAMRGKAGLAVDDLGISVLRKGEIGFLIPQRELVVIDAVSATIDKGVERDGLTAIAWNLGATKVVTHFRFTRPEVRKEFENKVSQLIGAQIG